MPPPHFISMALTTSPFVRSYRNKVSPFIISVLNVTAAVIHIPCLAYPLLCRPLYNYYETPLQRRRLSNTFSHQKINQNFLGGHILLSVSGFLYGNLLFFVFLMGHGLLR